METRSWTGMVLVRVVAGLLLWSELVSCQGGGWWETVVENAGISTMHAAVTHMGNVVLLDRTNIGDSELPLPPGVCRKNSQDRVSALLLLAPILQYWVARFDYRSVKSSVGEKFDTLKLAIAC